MEFLLIGLVWLLNFGISIWNAYACGKVWVESRMIGGWLRFMVWMGAAMSACGFSWCYLIFAGLTAYHFGWITPEQFAICLQAGYVILIPVILFAGWAITLDSWVQAWRRRDMLSMGTAAWNTFASIHNSYGAIQGFGPAFRNVVGYFQGSGDDDDKNNGVAVIIGLVLGCLIGGVLTTMAIIYKVAGNTPLPPREVQEY